MNQLSSTAWWVLLLFVVLIAGVPFGIWYSLRRSNFHDQIDLFRKASGRMSRPWEHEDANIKELSQRVADLKDTQSKPPKE
jgi:hypothetical protein